MNIGDNYKLEADTNNLILYQKITPEQEAEEALLALASGDEPDTEGIIPTSEPTVKWKRLGYFSTIEGVLNYIVRNELIGNMNLQSLEQLVEGQQKLTMLILALDFKSITLKSLSGKKPQPTSGDEVIKDNAQEQQEESLSPPVLS